MLRDSELQERFRSVKRWLARLALLLLAAGLLVVISGWLFMRSSLPQLDGKHSLAGLGAAVSVQRDERGVVTVKASSSEDLARATGFVHAQERFFQMDLLRRSAAGEVAALVGAAAVEYDVSRRRHNLRAVAGNILETLPGNERHWLQAYAEGVNVGLAALNARPFEYGLLRTAPSRWLPEDSLLVIFAMYFDLHDEDACRERSLAALHAVFPAAFVDFLVPTGTPWDAPVSGDAFPLEAVPGTEVVDFRERDLRPQGKAGEELLNAGSNNWAIDGTLSVTGAPIIANDMHLGLGVPNIWFRMRLELHSDNGFAATGATLPGLPAMVVGSNGHIAWGFTNSYGDWLDLVRLETAGCEDGYRTPAGCESFSRIVETIDVAHGENVQRELLRTRWGPVLGNEGETLYALRWTAHLPEATNLELYKLAHAKNVSEALHIAQCAGMPPQNFVVADADGNIAWTIVGRIPRRVGHDGQLPLDSSQTEDVWQGWLSPEEYPVIVNPEHGRIWTANARVVDGEVLKRIGDGGYALGARAAQIRDRLFERQQFDEQDMLRLQLDDEARFLDRWHELLRELLDHDAIADVPARAEIAEELSKWQDHAAVDAVAYRFVRGFRNEVHARILDALTADAKAVYADFDVGRFSQSEGPVWQLIGEQPAHLLPAGYSSWRELLLHAVDSVHQEIGSPLEQQGWGKRNLVQVRHPLGGLPLIGLLLNAEPRSLPGDNHMPRVQGRSFGASERFAVSPGQESRGYFHMPGGQSGHPLSPFYLAGHADWEAGAATPFLPGETLHELKLLPGAN